ncbi:MAG TPA: phospho-sugar mutase, partial [Spirochaetales bacterium]|nr:phospho-sugar mutase [Spirochaetales bacterium]
LLERLDELYVEHGYHEEKGINKYFEGADGMKTMQRIMEEFRTNPRVSLGGVKVQKVRDLKLGKVWDSAHPAGAQDAGFPSSDVIQWYLEDGTMVTVRPSGTEPKIKFYILARTAVGPEGLTAARADSAHKVSAIEADIKAVLA